MATKNLSVKLSLNDKQFQSSLRRATRSLKRFGSSMKRTGQAMSTSLTLPIAAIGGATVKLASDFGETQSKFNTIFRDISKDANDTAKNLQRDFGLSGMSAMKLLGNTGDLLTGFGFTQEEALKLSNDVNELAVDLASFTNVEGGAEAASLALTKALLGERESIKQLGIAITEADLKKFAEDQGLVFKELDRVAKATLTFELALKQSANAVGDHARTQGSLANRSRKLREDIIDLGTTFGQKLLPIAQKIVDKVSQLISFFQNLDDETKKQILGFTLLTAAVGPFLIVLGSLLTTLIALGPQFFLIATAITALATGISYVVDNFEAFKERFSDFDFIRNAIIDITSFIIKYNPFSALIEAYNFLVKTIGRGKFDHLLADNLFNDLADEIENLKKPTKEYEHQFNSFGDSMSNTIDKLLPKFGDFFKAMGGGTGSGLSLPTQNLGPVFGGAFNQGDQVAGLMSTINKNLGFKTETPFTGLLVKTEEELEELSDKFKSLEEVQNRVKGSFESFGNVFKGVFAQALQSSDGFFKTFVEGSKQALSALMAQLAATIILNALLGGSDLGGLLGFSDIGGLGGIGDVLKGLPFFSNGGLVTGATLGMVGEGPRTSISNPEVIAPLDKLKGFIGEGGGAIEVFGTISGQDILLSSTRASNNRLRTRGY